MVWQLSISPDLTFQCRVLPQQAGLPFAEAMAARFPYLPQDEWQRLIAAGSVLLNGAMAGPARLLSAGDTITSKLNGYQEPTFATELAIVHEDENFLLIDKPAGLPVSRTGRIV
ncbi:MAG: hypothetical protein OEV91_10830, partial [Desulfobulbaceae bacterium]|nr:hypothetical protein [Desulfobulbaceae bacterium]